MQFESADDRKTIDKLLVVFQTFCVGAVNPTYERYMFNGRVQALRSLLAKYDVWLTRASWKASRTA